MMDEDDDLERYSGKPFTAEEWRKFRRDMAVLSRVRPLVDAYENGRVIGGFALKVGAWVFGAAAAVLAVFGSLRYLNWWPFTGVGG